MAFSIRLLLRSLCRNQKSSLYDLYWCYFKRTRSCFHTRPRFLSAAETNGYYFLQLKQLKDNTDTSINSHNIHPKGEHSDEQSEKQLSKTVTEIDEKNYVNPTILTDDHLDKVEVSDKVKGVQHEVSKTVQTENTDMFDETRVMTNVTRDDASSSTLPVSPDEISEYDSNDFKRPNPLSRELNEDIDEIAPVKVPTFNFAAYINQSESLKQLVNLGVDLYKIEKNRDDNLKEFYLQIDFEKTVKPFILFLTNLGVPIEEIGTVITKSPFILRVDDDDLNVRVNYLKSKKFSPDAIARIVHKAPRWLTIKTKEIDRRIGVLQKMFALTGDEVRNVVTRFPKVVTFIPGHAQLVSFCVKEEMGFTNEQMKMLFVSKPKIWTSNKRILLVRFDYLHNKMGLSHQQIIQFPNILRTRKLRLRDRHLFLKSVGRAQYDETKPQYVSLQKLVSHSDAEFCSDVAKRPLDAFNDFLKTLS